MCHVERSDFLHEVPQKFDKNFGDKRSGQESMARWSGLAALAVIGLLVVAANAEVFYKEDFTGMRSISRLSRLGLQSLTVLRARS